jgi:hypothetical protein
MIKARQPDLLSALTAAESRDLFFFSFSRQNGYSGMWAIEQPW